MDSPDEARVREIKQREAASTPGPWYLRSRCPDQDKNPNAIGQWKTYIDRGFTVGFCGIGAERGSPVMPQTAGMTFLRPEDEAFLNHAHTDIRFLLILLAAERERRLDAEAVARIWKRRAQNPPKNAMRCDLHGDLLVPWSRPTPDEIKAERERGEG